MRKPSSNAEAAALAVRLTWLTVFRTVANTLLLVALAARVLSSRSVDVLSVGDVASFGLIAIAYAMNLVFGISLRRGSASARVAWVQVCGDVLLASGAVFVTGGADSPFSFFFLLSVIGASVLLFGRGAMIAALLSALSYLVVVMLSNVGGFSVTSARPFSQVAIEVVSTITAQLLIAVLSGYITEQWARTRGQLFAREQDLREIVDLQNRIVSAMPSGLVTCDSSGQVTFVNPSAEAILGHAKVEAGRHIEQLLPGLGRLKLNVRRSELHVETTAGERILGLTVTPLEPDTGSLLVVFQDLTDLRRLERELQEIDHLAMLGRFSATLAHEVRNPLASMRGAAQILANDASEGSHNAKLAKLVLRESDRLAGLVEEYLKLARPPPPNRAPRRLDEIVQETVEMLRADPSMAEFLIETELSRVMAKVDAGQIKQILINLLRNAVAASGDRAEVRVHLRSTRDVALIEVWDSGGSIPENDLHRIFDPFFTTKRTGTGLGLATVRSLVQAHGGTIDVVSAPDRGTTFTVSLPRAEGE